MTIVSYATQKLRPDQTLYMERRVMSYTVGASSMSKVELRRELALAEADPELRGEYRKAVITRYNQILARIKPHQGTDNEP